MSSSLYRHRERLVCVLVLTLAAVGRLLIILSVPSPKGYGAFSYVRVLHEHWDTLILRGTLLPPLNYLIEALPILVLGVEGNAAMKGTLWAHGLMGVGATWAVWAALRVLQVPLVASAVLALLTSVALVPLEVWGWRLEGGHYDVPTPLFMALLVYAVARAVRDGLGTPQALLLGVVGALLMLQMATAAYFVPVMFGLMFGSAALVGRLGRLRCGIALLGPPLLVLAALSVKNGIVTGVYAPGARGGAPMLMFVQRAMGSSDVEVRNLAVEAGVPDWYLWCYDHVELPPGERVEGMWGRLAKAFGTCAPWSAGPSVAGQPWPFDFSGIVAQLEASGRPDLAAVVREDQRDSLERQWVFAGHSPELSARWVAIHGQQSQRVGAHLLRTQPGRYLNAAWRLHQDLFWGKGPEFLGQAAYWAGIDFWQRDRIGWLARFAFAGLLRAAYTLLPVAFLLALLLWLRGRVTGNVVLAYGWLMLPVAACAIVYSAAVAVENDRYFVHIVPVLVVVAGLLFRDLTRVLQGRRHA